MTPTLFMTPQARRLFLLTSVALASLASMVCVRAEPKHRYRFDDASGSALVKDSVGTAHGTLRGGATLNGNGTLTLDGTDGYVDLPNGIISGLTDAAFEAWVTWTGTRIWERIFDFGSNSAGQDAQGTGHTYLFVSPRGGPGNVRFAISTNSGAGEAPVLEGAAPLPRNQPTHVAVSYNISGGAVRLYVNGQRVAAGPATITFSSIEDLNVWVGRSNWNDPYFTGSFNEFRIYSGTLLDADVAASFAAGPDLLAADAPPQSPTLSVATLAGNFVISWPATATGFIFESTTALGSQAKWLPASETPVQAGGTNKVTITSAQGTRFFRLKK